MTNEYIIQKKNYNRAFQFSAEFNIKYDSADTVRCNSILVYKWLKEKFSRVYKLPYAIPPAFNKDKFDILYKPNEHFCCRFEHSDSKVQGRDWITEVEIISLDGKVLLGIKISYTTPEDSDYDRDIFSVPKFVWKIFSKNDLRDVRELKKNILEADTEEKLIELHDLIINENRLFPVIVVTDSEYDTANWTEARIFSEGLLYRLGLVAHVAYLPREMCLRWKELVGEGWDVYNGAIRTYYENPNFDDDNFRDHPLFTPKQIFAFEYTCKDKKTGNEKIFTGVDAFVEFLCDKIESHNTHLRLDWKSRGHQFFYVASINLRNERLRLRENQIGDEWEELYKQEIDDLKKLNDDLSRERDSALQERDRFKETLKEEQKIRHNLEAYNEFLLDNLAKAGKAVDIFPKEFDYKKLPDWIMTHFSGKITLSNRAKRALNNAVYEDKPLVWYALKLLGTEYRQMRMGIIERSVFEQKCNDLHLEESATISDSRAGEKDDVYFLTDSNGRKRKLDRHLKKGVGHDDRICLRIYFYWDEDSKEVVIGSLPGHLETRKT